MILSDKKIKELMERHKLYITPITDEQIQPASVDVRLGSHFLIPSLRSGIVKLDQEALYDEVTSKSIVIAPHSFMLATTMEYIELPDNLTAFVEGRSSVGRLGLFIQNAGWVDPGFEGEITLELYNASSCPIELQAGWRIGQLVFAQMDQAAERPYNGKYQGQRNATGSRIFLDVTTT